MTRTATVVPEETDLLCEGCGYTLNGLPTSGNCPECGKPIDESIGAHRHLSEFEASPGWATFLRTSAAVIGSPKSFYRSLSSRASTAAARAFSRIHLAITTVLFSLAIIGHLRWAIDQVGYSDQLTQLAYVVAFAIAPPVIFLLLLGLTSLAAWLSSIEARYWGMRLPYPVVLRGLLFHRAHYLPVGALAVVVVWGYRFFGHRLPLGANSDTTYLYSLCGVVIASALYLFQTYWVAMKNLMWANR